MMITFSKYSLFPREGVHKKPREGALLKVSFDDNSFGYADCHPWVELGDAPLNQQLELLRQGNETALTKQSLKFAKIDAEARNAKKHLFHGLNLPKNHYHISDSSLVTEELLHKISNDGINLVKIKMGINFQNDCKFLKDFSPPLRSFNLKLRLDFNCKLVETQFLEMINHCSSCLDVIDFFEDPFLYEPGCWQKIREDKKIKLACDRDSSKALIHPNSCDYLVVKPAIQDVTPFLLNESRPLVLTSYLDHPIGQLSSLYIASKILTSKTAHLSECGFLSHNAYAPTPFSGAFQQTNAQLVPSSDGFGWGYNDLLNQLEWRLLS